MWNGTAWHRAARQLTAIETGAASWRLDTFEDHLTANSRCEPDNRIHQGIDPLDPDPNDCLPLYLNPLLLRLRTSLLLGVHTDAGKALAIYSGCMGAAPARHAAAGRVNERVPAEQTSDFLAVLRDHRDTANHIGGSFVALPPLAPDAPAVSEAQDEAERLMRAAWQLAQRTLRGLDVEAGLAAVDAKANS